MGIRIQSDGRSFKGEPFCKRGHPKVFGVRCAECQRVRNQKWQDANGAAKAEELRERYRSDDGYRDSVLSRNRAYQAEHAEESVERTREWREQNRPRYNATNRAYYKRIKAEHAKRVKSWKQRNPEVWRSIDKAAKSRRRARLKGCLGSHTGAEWRAIVAKQRGRCARCGMKKKLEKDHIVPLALGGSDMACNLQGLCKPCNGSKQATLAEGTQLGIFDRLKV